MCEIPNSMNRIEDLEPEKSEAYLHGFDCGKNGPNTTNCHFSIFGTKEGTSQWEKGKADGEKQK
jgi:hypothetical protein